MLSEFQKVQAKGEGKMVSIPEIEDKLAIQELMARYHHASSFGDIETWVNCFTEDGVFECFFGALKGRTALRQYMTERTMERREHPLRHLATNIIINVQGDQASAKCYVLLLQVSPEGVRILSTAIYNDKLTKVGGAWRFSHRKVDFDNTAWAPRGFPASFLERCELEQKHKKSR